MPLYGLEVQAILHDAAHQISAKVADGLLRGHNREDVLDDVREEVMKAAMRVIRQPLPCGAKYKLFPMATRWRICGRTPEHEGDHEGDLK